jgi:hypothetical protein
LSRLGGSVIPGLPVVAEAFGRVGGVLAEAGLGVVAAGVGWYIQTLVDGGLGLVGEFEGFVDASTHPRVTAASFIEPGGAYHTVASIAVVLLVGFVFLGVIQGLAAGEPGQALFRLLRDIPVAVLAIVGFPWLVDQLLTVTDGLSAAILPSGETTARLMRIHLLEGFKVIGAGLAQLVLALVVYAAILLVYVELVVRSVLVYLTVALAALSFAAIVWPAARGAARKVVEFVAAAILAKPAIFVALRVGLDLAAQQAEASPVDGAAWGKLVVAVAVGCVAAFAPWVVWRLMPHAEAALVAQGMSRAPVRSGMRVLQTAFWLQAMRSRGSSPGGLAQGPGPQPGGLGPPRTLPAPPGGGFGGGGRAAAGSSGGSAAVGGAASAAAGPAAAGVAAVVAAGKAARDQVTATADRQTTSAAGGAAASEGAAGATGGPSAGWQRRPQARPQTPPSGAER